MGVIRNGIDYFLLFFYSQIIGLSALLAGAALAIALVFDALSDPIVGYVSDNWRSRWGRRHPFMYLSILPMAGLYVLVWFPPYDAGSQWQLFLYLLVVTILLRQSMTFFDVPSNALVAELTPDYDNRTNLASLKVTVGWITGTLMSIAMYMYWITDSSAPGDGVLRAAGYQEAALVGGFVALIGLTVSVVGLHPEIPRLHGQVVDRAIGMREMLHCLRDLLGNPNLRALLLSGLFLAVGAGTTATLWIYQYSSFYGVNTEQMSILVVVQLLATFAVVPVVRFFIVGRDKKKMAILITLTSAMLSTILPPLHVLEILPARGSDALLQILIAYDFVQQLLGIVLYAVLFSLFADVTENVQVETGRRLDATILACQTFISKSATALGALVAGALLSLIRYPEQIETVHVASDVQARLGLSYMVSWLVMACIAAWLLSGYRISRASHLAEINALGEDFPTRAA